MISDKKLANAVGGKTARACDNCVRKRARWYCATDDAFLCQTCDSSVHSANPLARRHDRVRLNTSSFKLPPNQGKDESDSMQCYPCDNTQVVSKLTQGVKSLQKASSDVSVASWHSGFTRKARSTRFKKQGKSNSGEEKGSCPHHLVPDEVSDDTSQEENVEQLLYQVPVFDPFKAELCHSSNSKEVRKTINHFEDGNSSEYRNSMLYENQFHASLPSEMDLAEFAADVENLLGKGLENESFHMEELEMMDMDCSFGRGEVKVEEVGIAHDQENDGGHQITTVPFEFKFDDCSLEVYEEENNIQPHQNIRLRGSEETDEKEKGKILLSLDYDGVMNAWDEKKCPWTSGGRPQLDIHDNCWPYSMGTCGKVHNFGDYGPMGHAPPVDVWREARVSRYREKRRTRLFSKKIRYEVRKLNAEKRPRLKGRFVKRTSFAASAFPLLNK